ncbi:hypothetical protein SKAU_G00139290 [Synaphobranchus kaupii]|uniref:Uncharacterized protein n=1 Tax=Synaphobranchus kaupii TaxID=118154 RepID=A0A9Q1FS36_SYNKA|nr:hypothetical protein SKAU_G00139290 [Synaphobranchus kaupii]
MEGLNSMRRLAHFHPESAQHLPAGRTGGAPGIRLQVQNLRSQVSPCCRGDCWPNCTTTCGTPWIRSWTGPPKLSSKKPGESNRSIREEVDVALRHMRHSCTPSCALKALINRGLRWAGQGGGVVAHYTSL